MSDDTAKATTAGEHSADASVRPTDEEVPAESATARRPQYAPPQREEFDWRGWFLVGVVVVSFLVVPAVILYLPYARSTIDTLGIGFRTAYLTLPMIPALLLGATAVWAAVTTRRS